MSDQSDPTRQVDFVLYKMEFQPIKFNYWNTWYKKLAHKLLGPRKAYWLFYRNALKISYSGNSLVSEVKSVRPE